MSDGHETCARCSAIETRVRALALSRDIDPDIAAEILGKDVPEIYAALGYVDDGAGGLVTKEELAVIERLRANKATSVPAETSGSASPIRPQSIRDPHSPRPFSDSGKKTALLVADQRVRQLFRKPLALMGFEVTECESEEWAAFELSHSRPHLVVTELDLSRTEPKGSSVLGGARVAYAAHRLHVPVVVVSGAFDQDTCLALRALDAGPAVDTRERRVLMFNKGDPVLDFQALIARAME
jgi:hypothetical protein